MYTKEQVDEVLSQVEQEIQKSLGMIKSENTSTETKEESVQEEVVAKSEESKEDLDYTDEDFETIEEIYAGMTKSEKEAHYSAIKKALFGEETKEEPIVKSESKEEEKTVETKEENKEESLLKSEVETMKAENEELKKSVETMAELVNKLMNGKKAPAQKAVTATSYIAKSEDVESKESKIEKMSKSEITSKLKSLDYATLNKSDREAINNFYLKNSSVDSIKHLIKE